MVRLLIPLVAIFLIWLLFFSSFSKQWRIGLSSAAVLLLFIGLWLDMSGQALSSTRINPSQVSVCGITGEYSYRSNYNLTICFENTATKGTVKRLQLKYVMQNCDTEACTELGSQEEMFHLSIPAGERVEYIDNVSFTKQPANAPAPSFKVEIIKVWSSS